MRIPNRFLFILIIALLIGLSYGFRQTFQHSTKESSKQQVQENRHSKSTNRVSAKPLTIEGKKAPGFELETLDGKHTTLNDFKGHTILLVTWATWCKECHEELQTLQKVSESDNQSFNIVLINMTSEESSLSDVRKYVSEKHLTLPVLLDQKGKFEKSYHVQVIPTSVLIDSYGNVLHTFYGPVNVPTLTSWLPSA